MAVAINHAYPVRVKLRCRELSEAGFGPQDVARLLAREFELVVPYRTILYWRNPEAQDEDRRRQRRAQRARMLRRRAEHLRELGLSFRAISVVLAVYHDEHVSPERVRYRLTQGGAWQ